MRFSFALAALLATLKVGESFVPSQSVGRWENQVLKPVFSTVEATDAAAAVETPEVPAEANGALAPSNSAVSAAEIKAKLEAQLAKLREKDSKSPKLSKEVSGLQVERKEWRVFLFTVRLSGIPFWRE